MPDDIHQSHDKLFKAGFSDPATAAGFLRTQLPEEVAAAIDWPRLARPYGVPPASALPHRHSRARGTGSLAPRQRRKGARPSWP